MKKTAKEKPTPDPFPCPGCGEYPYITQSFSSFLITCESPHKQENSGCIRGSYAYSSVKDAVLGWNREIENRMKFMREIDTVNEFNERWGGK